MIRTFAVLMCLAMSSTAWADLDLSTLEKGDTVAGFRVAAVYLNDTNAPFGARFVHGRSGFTLDLLRIESVPQSYTWVNSFPVSDQGEPHTQEHLLLGKGTVGRAYSGMLTMSLAGESAFTQQWRTSYHFNTVAGPDVFFDVYATELNALLHPNYTDEEIRREVRNFGVAENPDGTLRLEEKGTVYNEMVSSSGNPFRQLLRASSRLVYGPDHPLAFNSGGEPSGIRTMKPEDIRRFHADHYYLANMGSIVALPSSIGVRDALAHFDAILGRLQPQAERRAAMTMNQQPKPKPAAAGSVVLAEYPQKNDQQPSPIAFVWPADRELSVVDRLLLNLFVDNVAGDPTTNLYKKFIDSRTRTVDIGARSVFGMVDDGLGFPVIIGLVDVAAPNLNEAKLASIRGQVTGEIARVASFADGSDELKQFNARAVSRIIEQQRDLAKFVNSPPRFGFRSVGSAWMDHLLLLEETPEFRKSVTLGPELQQVRAMLDSGKNFWRDRLAAWKITGVTPYAVAAKPSPEMIARDSAERLARSSEEAARLAKLYGTEDVQAAIKRYRGEYDAESARIETDAQKIPRPAFVKSPPMTMDDPLRYAVATVEGTTLVSSTFDNMSSGTVGLALRVDAVPREDLRWVPLLPLLLTRVGVIEKGKPVSYEEMSERLRKEILGLDSDFSTSTRTGRVELALRGSGNNATEARRAVEWMQLVLQHPDWRPENLPRIRDVVDQAISRYRNLTSGSEESWVRDPAEAWLMQSNPAYLSAASFQTQLHDALRLRWLLKEAAPEDRDALAAFFNATAAAGKTASRAELKKLAGGSPPENLSPAGRAIAAEALKDLDLTLGEIPDGSLAGDWAAVCALMRDALMVPPAEALQSLDRVRARVLHRGNARMWTVGSTATQKALAPSIATLARSLDLEPAPRQQYGSVRLLDARVAQRLASAGPIVYAGLLAPNMKGGVIITAVPGVQYADWNDREKQLDYLSSRLYAGGGSHGIFLKTIGAGLAYSNGLRGQVASGRYGYYAERTPDLAQTVKFVTGELKKAQRDPGLVDYAVSQLFREVRSDATYESRAEAMAADLADGQTPEQVRKFREAILELKKDPKLSELLYARMDAVNGKAIPGFNVKGKDVPGAVYFLIGPDKQLDSFNDYIRGTEGEGGVTKVYARDFWIDP